MESCSQFCSVNILYQELIKECSIHRVNQGESDLRKQPKFIVFLSQLLLLFQVCPTCSSKNPLVEVTQVGTMVEVTTSCGNSQCSQKERTWRSQPYVPGTKIPAGNFLLSFGILLCGGSASKVLRLFSHMGLQCISLSTFFRHQRVRLFLKKYRNIMSRFCSDYFKHPTILKASPLLM